MKAEMRKEENSEMEAQQEEDVCPQRACCQEQSQPIEVLLAFLGL